MNQSLIHLKLLFVAVVWGFGWPAGRVLAQDIPPISAAWIRYVIAMACFLIYLKMTDNWRIPTRMEWKRIVLIGFFSTFIYQVLFMYGMKYTAAGDASLMITFNPIFTALLAIPFLDEKMNWRLATGLLCGLSGVIVIFLYSPNIDIPFDLRMKGDLMIAGAALAWASSSILQKKAMTSTTSDSDNPLSPLHLTVWASLVGLLILTPWAAYESMINGFPQPSFDGWMAILFLAILSTVISYVWFADGIVTIGAGKAALYVYLVAPFGILGGWLILDEKLGWSLVASFLLIIVGVMLAQYNPNKLDS
ncbi:MAG: DMT family transporter [Candidatus Poseidoniaceae archaeon]|nr:DMT family transporter [Candidatus Poseidoniaceae archaeon]